MIKFVRVSRLFWGMRWFWFYDCVMFSCYGFIMMHVAMWMLHCINTLFVDETNEWIYGMIHLLIIWLESILVFVIVLCWRIELSRSDITNWDQLPHFDIKRGSDCHVSVKLRDRVSRSDMLTIWVWVPWEDQLLDINVYLEHCENVCRS